jgi:hypothetical protein
MPEIRIALKAVRMKSNDLSVTAAIGCLLYVNGNRDPEKSEPLTDYSQFLPFPSEFQDDVESTSGQLNVLPATARMILAYYHIFNSRSIGVISVYIDEIRKIANQ